MRLKDAGRMILLAALLTGCQLGTAEPAPTAPLPTDTVGVEVTATEISDTPTTAATQTPAATATATATPTLTASPTVAATETPAAPATPDPNQGVGDVIYQETFDGTSRWGWGFTDDAVSFTNDNGSIKAVTTRGDAGWRVTIGPGDSWLDQQILLTTDTTACTESDEIGLLFRGALDDKTSVLNGYVFKFTCGGTASVDVVRDNQPSVLVDPVEVTVNPTGKNELLVWAGRNEMRFYVNGKFVASAEDATFTSGRLGLYVRDRDGGGMTVAFQDLTVRGVTPP